MCGGMLAGSWSCGAAGATGCGTAIGRGVDRGCEGLEWCEYGATTTDGCCGGLRYAVERGADVMMEPDSRLDDDDDFDLLGLDDDAVPARRKPVGSS